jgi:uncharacterized membrane protein (DUF4010 family)
VEAVDLALDPAWLRFGASLGIGLLIGLERERNPAGKAGVRTFALVALFGALAAELGHRLESFWSVPVGLAVVAAMLITEYARESADKEPGTTTVVAAAVCYLLGVLAGIGEAQLAGALAIGVTALLYFKPELEGFSAGLARHEQVSVLQFLVVAFIVLPIAPDADLGPYGVLNPREIWLVVVLISGIGLASYVALRVAGAKHGTLLVGLLGGMVSSTATTMLYARRSRDSDALHGVAARVVPIANLVPLPRIALFVALLAPGLLPRLAAPLALAMLAGLAVQAVLARRSDGEEQALPEMRNPASLGTALRFAALYALVLVLAAWLSDVVGTGGLVVAALVTGLTDIDPIVLSALRLFGSGAESAAAVAAIIGLAFLSNVLFKLGMLAWFDRRLALRVAAPLGAAVAAGGLALWAVSG